MKKYEVLRHSSIRLEDNEIIYVDPFEIDKVYEDADYIFITHSHYDHLSIEDIKRIIKKETIIITPQSGEKDLKNNFPDNEIIIVEPNKEYEIKKVSFETTNAYNLNKNFHLKENKWVGYLIKLNKVKYYIAGDTDYIAELKNIRCDIAFLPIGGKYTMNYEEAADMANKIDAKIIVPTHYGSIVGKSEDAYRFKENVIGKNVEIQIK